MDNKKDSSAENIYSKVKRKSPSPKKLTKRKILPRSKTPDISVVNVIERISLLLRKEAQNEERKRASGE